MKTFLALSILFPFVLFSQTQTIDLDKTSLKIYGVNVLNATHSKSINNGKDTSQYVILSYQNNRYQSIVDLGFITFANQYNLEKFTEDLENALGNLESKKGDITYNGENYSIVIDPTGKSLSIYDKDRKYRWLYKKQVEILIDWLQNKKVFMANQRITESNGCRLVMNEVDEFTGAVNKRIATEIVGNSSMNSLTSSIFRMDSLYALTFIYNGDLGCLTSDSYLILKFDDNSTMKLMNFAKMDCGKNPELLVNITSKTEILKAKKVLKIRIVMNDGSSDVEIVDTSYIIKGLNCLK